jgi:hypothetical protein
MLHLYSLKDRLIVWQNNFFWLYILWTQVWKVRFCVKTFFHIWMVTLYIFLLKFKQILVYGSEGFYICAYTMISLSCIKILWYRIHFDTLSASRLSCGPSWYLSSNLQKSLYHHRWIFPAFKLRWKELHSIFSLAQLEPVMSV